MILSALVEGNSINATSRLCGCSKITVLRLLSDAGTVAAAWHDEHVRSLQAERVQADEIWSFVGCKDKARREGASGLGSVWTWIALDANSKLAISYTLGDRLQPPPQIDCPFPGSTLRSLFTDEPSATSKARHGFGARGFFRPNPARKSLPRLRCSDGQCPFGLSRDGVVRKNKHTGFESVSARRRLRLHDQIDSQQTAEKHWPMV